MSHSSRSFRRSAICLLSMLSGVCAAQQGTPQFTLPRVFSTSGQVTSFQVGQLQKPQFPTTDIFYVTTPTGSGANTSVSVGELLSNQSGAFFNLNQDQITFANTSNVAVALADINNDHILDYVFALTPTSPTGTNLCIYFGSGLGVTGTAYRGPGNPPNQYPPNPSGQSGCIAFPVSGSNPPNFAYVATPSFKQGFLPQVLIEDSANNLLYLFSNNGSFGSSGGLPGISFNTTISIPAADGAGPITVGDFNGDGSTDFILNGQTGHSATVYLGDGLGNFTAQPPLHFDHNVHSLLMQDMDGDGILDMVVEGDKGVIEIFKGHADGTFGPLSIGGTATNLDGFSGNGGHLAAIGKLGKDTNLSILTTTPIGLSVLQQTPLGTLKYALSGIYNIGPGRTSFALADFDGDGYTDLAVDSPEGVAVVLGDKTGLPSFQTSRAYASLAPALSSTVAKFRTIGGPDVVVSTGAAQGQLLTGNGAGGFTTFVAPTDTSVPLNIPANLWSNVVSGDFNGDGIPDIAYSLTGLPLPATGTGVGLYVQYGNGLGTFAAPIAVTTSSVGVASNNTFFGTSAVGDFNGDNIADLANVDAAYDDTLLGQSTSNPFSPGLNQLFASATSFDQVAAGFFKANRLAKQDLIVQQGSSLIPYVNSGDGKKFTAMPALAGGPSGAFLIPSTIVIADLDGDTNGDVVVAYYNISPIGLGPIAPNQVYIWYGNGDGTFGPGQAVTLGRNDYLAAVADLNNDGLPDIVLSDGSIVTVLYNQGSRSFKSDFGTACNPCAEQHFLAGQGINSLSLADVNNDGTGDLIVANGGAAISNPLAIGGATKSSISLTPNPNVNTGGITVLLNNIVTKPITATLTASLEPSGFQSAFTITATLTPSVGVAVPTGFVYFYFDAVPLGNPVPVTPSSTTSSASYTVPAANIYAPGTHTLTAQYNGDAVNSTLVFNGAPGTHQIVSATTTSVLDLCVGPTIPCPTSGTVDPGYTAFLPMIYGQTYNGIGKVTSSDGATPGFLSFNETYGGVTKTICQLVASAGGTCPPSVGIGAQAGVHIFTASYAGDATHGASTSLPVTITVAQDTATATVTSSLNPASQGQPVTFTATLAGTNAPLPNAGAAGLYFPPAGTVTFFDATTILGTGNLTPSASGLTSIATFTTSTLTVGPHPITVSYAGSLDFAATVSPVYIQIIANQVIVPPPPGTFTLTVTPNPVTVGVGYTAGFTVTVTQKNGLVPLVNLACATLPSEMTCTFLNAAIAAGGGSTTLFVATSAPHTCGTTQPYFLGINGGGRGIAPFALPALAGLLAIFIPGKRRWLRALVTILIAAAATQMIGCGTCTDLGNRPGTYTFAVTGSAAGTSETESQTVTLNVKI